MNLDAEEAAFKAAKYGYEDKLRFTKLMDWLFIASTIAGLLFLALMFHEPGDTDMSGLSFDILLGWASAGTAFTGKYEARFKKL